MAKFSQRLAADGLPAESFLSQFMESVPNTTCRKRGSRFKPSKRRGSQGYCLMCAGNISCVPLATSYRGNVRQSSRTADGRTSARLRSRLSRVISVATPTSAHRRHLSWWRGMSRRKGRHGCRLRICRGEKMGLGRLMD